MSRDRARAGLAAWVTAVLLASAVVATGYRLSLAMSRQDSDAVEATCLLPVARQITDGPGGLYGPFNGRNPYVLIHAPLYYRLAALLAWPLCQAGLDPVAGSRAAGRALSLVALLASLGLVDRLARLGGAPRQAGWWAALLVAAVPILGGLPVTVRADMLGIALQTAGVVLVLAAIDAKGARPALIPAGFALMAAAVCVKQHLVVVPGVSIPLLLAARMPGRFIVRGVFLALAIVTVVYATEALLTGGRVFASVFLVAASVGRIRPSDWGRALGVSLEVGHWSLGLITVLTAAALAAVSARPGKVRRVFSATAAVVLIATILLYALGGRARWNNLPQEYGGVVVLPLLIVAAALIEPRGVVGNRIDAALWVYWVCEVALAVVLLKSSTGSWTNYALQAEVFACVLTARALQRAFDSTATFVSLTPAALAVFVVLHLVWVDAADDHNRRARDRDAVRLVVRHLGRDPRDAFFVGRPDLNLEHGRPDLAYDDWLYPIFEVLGQAERRSVWLPGRIVGSVRHVVMSSRENRIDGVDSTLLDLGFVPSRRLGPFYIWEQVGFRSVDDSPHRRQDGR